MPIYSGLKSRFSQFNDALRNDEMLAMQLVMLLVGLIVSISIGYLYSRSVMVAGWQLWTWLVTVFFVLGGLLAAVGRPPKLTLARWRWLLAIAAAALLLRIVMLETIPGGLHVDEYGVADFTLRHVYHVPGETLNPFRSGPASHPSLYHYLVRLSLLVGGNSITGLRLSSVIAGTLGVLATYAVIAQLDTRKTALIGAALMAGYHFHIHWSRIGLNNIWDTVWVPVMLASYAWGWRHRWRGGAILAGASIGFSQYFYPGSRLGLLLLGFLVVYLWREERDSRRLLTYVGLLILTAIFIAGPLIIYAISDPVPFFERSQTVFGWRTESIVQITGNPPDRWSYAWYQLWRSVGAFVSVPDVTGFYGPGVPLLIGLAAPLFTFGFFWAIYKRQLIPVLWIMVTVIFGGFLLLDPPGSSHYVVAIPAICWLIAIPLNQLMERGHLRLALALLSLILLTDIVFYFAIYVPGNPRDLIHPFPPFPQL